MKFLFHVHTEESACSNLKKQEIINYLNKNGFGAISITDHNKITRLDWSDGAVIPAEEIATGEGDVIGLFLSKEIKTNQGMKKTLQDIKNKEIVGCCASN
jgi:predicted metal-dependent phosphoesterase TrpH